MPAVPEWPGGFRDPKWVLVDGVFWGRGRETVSHLTELNLWRMRFYKDFTANGALMQAKGERGVRRVQP